jgi:hypothetical protein
MKIANDTTHRATVPVQERLAVTLRFLAKGDLYTNLQFRNMQSSELFERPIDLNVVFTVSVVILWICWVSEHRLSLVQFHYGYRAFVIPLY